MVILTLGTHGQIQEWYLTLNHLDTLHGQIQEQDPTLGPTTILLGHNQILIHGLDTRLIDHQDHLILEHHGMDLPLLDRQDHLMDTIGTLQDQTPDIQVAMEVVMDLGTLLTQWFHDPIPRRCLP